MKLQRSAKIVLGLHLGMSLPNYAKGSPPAAI